MPNHHSPTMQASLADVAAAKQTVRQARIDSLHKQIAHAIQNLRDETQNWLKHYEGAESVPYYTGNSLLIGAGSVLALEARLLELSQP